MAELRTRTCFDRRSNFDPRGPAAADRIEERVRFGKAKLWFPHAVCRSTTSRSGMADGTISCEQTRTGFVHAVSLYLLVLEESLEVDALCDY